MVNYHTAYNEAVYKNLLKAFYNKTNEIKYNSQIPQYNIRHTNIITTKDIIAVAERAGENKELLAMENVDKTARAEVTKVMSIIDLGSKHN